MKRPWKSSPERRNLLLYNVIYKRKYLSKMTNQTEVSVPLNQTEVSIPLCVYTAIFGLLLMANHIWAIVNILVICTNRKRIPSAKYHAVLNTLVIVACCFRAAALVFDFVPFNETPPQKALSWSIIHMPVPAFFSAFCLVYAALKNMTRMRLISGRLFRTSFLILIVTINFAFSILANVVTAMWMPDMTVAIICEIYFILLGIIGFCGFMWDYTILYKSTVVNRRYLQEQSGISVENKVKVQKRGRAKQESTAWLSRDLTWVTRRCDSWGDDGEGDVSTSFSNFPCQGNNGGTDWYADAPSTNQDDDIPQHVGAQDDDIKTEGAFSMSHAFSASAGEGQLEDRQIKQPTETRANLSTKKVNHNLANMKRPISNGATSANPCASGVSNQGCVTSMPRVVRLALGIAVLMLIYTLHGLYGLVSICIHVQNDTNRSDYPIDYWMYKVSQCALETALAATILGVSSLSLLKKRNWNRLALIDMLLIKIALKTPKKDTHLEWLFHKQRRFRISGALLLKWITLSPAWISNHMPNKMWGEITYPFTNFNGNTV